MRILLVTQTYYPYLRQGGRPYKVRTLYEEMTKLGHQVSVLTVNHSKKREAFAIHRKRTGLGWQAREDDTLYLDSIPLYRIITLNPGAFGYGLSYLKNYDLVHIFGLYDFLGPTIAAFCRLHDIPYVVETMGMYKPVARNLRLKRAFNRFFSDPLLKHAAKIITTSNQERQELLQGSFSAEQVVIRRNGISIPPRPSHESDKFRTELGLTPDDFLILWLGRICSKKAIPDLIRAFAAAIEGDIDNAHLVIVGPDDDGSVPDLHKLSQSLELKDKVHILGPLYDDEKLQAFTNADLFVLNSIHENFGNVVLEAASMGTPSIVRDTCGVAEVVGGKCARVVHDAGKSLTTALHELMSNPEALRTLREKCHETCTQMTWENQCKLNEKIYCSVL